MLLPVLCDLWRKHFDDNSYTCNMSSHTYSTKYIFPSLLRLLSLSPPSSLLFTINCSQFLPLWFLLLLDRRWLEMRQRVPPSPSELTVQLLQSFYKIFAGFMQQTLAVIQVLDKISQISQAELQVPDWPSLSLPTCITSTWLYLILSSREVELVERQMQGGTFLLLPTQLVKHSLTLICWSMVSVQLQS